MILENISFDDKILTIADNSFELEYPIHDAVISKDQIIVLFDYMAKREAGQFNNLIAISREGNQIWVAEHPTTSSADVYTDIVGTAPFVVSNFAGYRCTIDIDTGKLKDAIFTK